MFVDFYSKVRNELSFLKGNLGVLILSWTLADLGYFLWSPFWPQYLRELGASPSIIWLLESILLITLFLSRFPGAYIADTYGRKKLIVVCSYAIVLIHIIYALAVDWRYIIIGTILWGIFMMQQPAEEAVAADSIPAEHCGLGFSLIRSLPNVSAILAPTLGAYIIVSSGYLEPVRFLILISSLLYLANAAIKHIYLEETLKRGDMVLRVDSIRRIFIESVWSMFEVFKALHGSLNTF